MSDSITELADQAQQYANSMRMIARECPDAYWRSFGTEIRVLVSEKVEPTDVEIFAYGATICLVAYREIVGVRVYHVPVAPFGADRFIHELKASHGDVYRTFVARAVMR